MSDDTSSQSPPEVKDRRPLIVFTWLWVGTPLAYGPVSQSAYVS
ncbi:MFS transporter small subunit [Streptomyces microflavus]